MNSTPVIATRTIEVTVDSLGGLGDGIASLNGKPVFIPKSCVGDQLEVQIVHENRDGMQGVISRVITPGKARQTAPCKYFDTCGGCTLQQLTPDAYQKFKTRILHSALAQAGFDRPDAEVLFLPPRTRRRVEFKIHRTPDGRIQFAFHSLRSHTPVVIDSCLVLHPALQALIAPLNDALSTLDLPPNLFAASLTQADNGIDLVLIFKGTEPTKIAGLDNACKSLGIARVCVRNTESKARILHQISPVEMHLGDYAITLPPAAFLQATSEGQTQLTDAVLSATKNAASVVDLFCGIGTYSFALSRRASAHAVELEKDMVQALRAGAKQHSIKTLTCEQRDLFKKPLSAPELQRYNAAVINPPRLGAKAQTEQLALSGISKVVMVSCNPATFARDAAILKKSVYNLESAHGIDQFLWSQHLEIVAVFTKG